MIFVFSIQEAERNTIIKDAMREACVMEMVESWFAILVSYAVSKLGLAEGGCPTPSDYSWAY